MDDDYDDANRAFLQAFLARGTLTYELSKPILSSILTVHEGREILPNDITEEDLRSYITTANIAISPLDLEIRSGLHQVTRERVYALVNTSSDALTQMATTHSAEEIAFVKRVLDWMFDGQGNSRRTEAMCITGTEAINLAKGNAGRRETQNANTQSQPPSQGLSMREAEAMMGRLVEEGWFEKSRKGFYSLSPRALMELRGWLTETYNDPEEEDEDGRGARIKFCRACREIVTVGQRCSKRECPCRLHEICTASFFRMQRNRNCPLCNTEWDGSQGVGEKAITTEKHRRGKRQNGAGRRSQQEAEEEVNTNDEG